MRSGLKWANNCIQSLECVGNMLMTYKLPSNLKIRLFALSVRALVLPNWNGYKNPQTVWNWWRKKNEQLCSCSHSQSQSLALSRSRQINEQAKMKCYYNSDAVPSATAFHITFNYYCIKNDKGFPWLELTKWVSRARAHTHTKKQTSNQMNENKKKTKQNNTRDSSLRESEWIYLNRTGCNATHRT